MNGHNEGDFPFGNLFRQMQEEIFRSFFQDDFFQGFQDQFRVLGETMQFPVVSADIAGEAGAGQTPREQILNGLGAPLVIPSQAARTPREAMLTDDDQGERSLRNVAYAYADDAEPAPRPSPWYVALSRPSWCWAISLLFSSSHAL